MVRSSQHTPPLPEGWRMSGDTAIGPEYQEGHDTLDRLVYLDPQTDELVVQAPEGSAPRLVVLAVLGASSVCLDGTS